MFFLFRNNKKSDTVANGARDITSQNIVNYCFQWQRIWSDWMQVQTERLSLRGKTISLVVLCLLVSGYSFWLITFSLTGKQNFSLSVASIERPKYLGQSGKEPIKASPAIDKEDYLKVHRFKGYMDSIARSPVGKGLYDSILNSRPGLMDSIQFIERTYQSQFNK